MIIFNLSFTSFPKKFNQNRKMGNIDNFFKVSFTYYASVVIP